jgi:hypothetical protein
MFPISDLMYEACLRLSDVVLRNIVRRERHRDGDDTAFPACRPMLLWGQGEIAGEVSEVPIV